MPGGRGPLEVALADVLDFPAGVVFLVMMLRAQEREIVVIGPAAVLLVLRMVKITVSGRCTAPRGSTGFIPHAKPGPKVGGIAQRSQPSESTAPASGWVRMRVKPGASAASTRAVSMSIGP